MTKEQVYREALERIIAMFDAPDNPNISSTDLAAGMYDCAEAALKSGAVEPKCPCGTAHLRVEGGYVPVCACAAKNSVPVEPTCECKEQREAWICVKCGKPEASVPHGNPLDQMAAGAELYGDQATPGYKR